MTEQPLGFFHTLLEHSHTKASPSLQFCLLDFEAVCLIIIYNTIWPMVFCCLFVPFAVLVFGGTEILF